MIERAITKSEIDSITTFLTTSDLFKNFDRPFLADLAQSMTLVLLEGGETLIKRGEIDKTLYIVCQGRLRVFLSSLDIANAEISSGEVIGEMALLTNQPRTATVIASRDSIMLKLNEELFQRIEMSYPAQALQIAKLAIRRLIGSSNMKVKKGLQVIAVAPAGDTDHRGFVRLLQKALSRVKPTIVVDKQNLNFDFRREIAESSLESSDNSKILAWMQSMESEIDFVIYETEQQLTSWTMRCLRQVDRILLVASEKADRSLNSIESYLFAKNITQLPSIDLIFLHEQDKISGTAEWLKSRPVAEYQHLRMHSQKDIDKLVRHVTGRSLGIVLNGGGARGMAHVGALNALEECNIPIDYIMGSSMGSLIAAGWALGLSPAEREEYLEKYAFRNQFTLPLASIMTGKRVSELCHALAGDINIEDLWMRYFCVSSNVADGKICLHDQGPLWFAVRASLSIPGIFPPVYDEEGNMLVDGGMMNNMPIDILRKKMFQGQILAIKCCSYFKPLQKKKIEQTWFSGWKLLLQHLNPFAKSAIEYDPIYKVIMESLNIASIDHEKFVQKQADYLLQFDTSQFNLLHYRHRKAIIEIGYRSTMEQLPKLLENGLQKNLNIYPANEQNAV